MGSRRSALFNSRMGRRIFAGFFVIVAVPLVAVALLSYELTSAQGHRATQQMMVEATKAITLNLFDRLRAAEALLRAAGPSAPAGHALSDQVTAIFETVREPAGTAALPMALSTLMLEPGQGDSPARPVMRVPLPGGKIIEGVMRPDYLWENLANGAYNVCIRADPMPAPYCLQPLQGFSQEASHTRLLHFAPYFEGTPWSITALPDEKAYAFLPFGAAGLLAQATGLAFLLALVASSYYSRRTTTPLDALMQTTRAVRAGDLAQRVDTSRMTDEFRELGDSFNRMVGDIGADLAFSQVLARMDQAILERRPLQEVMALALQHTAYTLPGATVAICVHDKPADRTTAYRIAPDGRLLATAAAPHNASAPADRLSVSDQDGQQVWMEVAGTTAGDLPARGRQELRTLADRLAVALHADEREQTLITRAVHDSLTGLLNRLGMVDAIDAAIDRAAALPPGLAVVFIDLDGFKDVNDAYGHGVGDRLLKEVAQRLSAALPAADTALARMGGDEFVLLAGPGAVPGVHDLLRQLLAALCQRYRIDDLDILIGASIGVALYPAHGRGHEELLKNADAAMYAAKAGGRNRIVEYSGDLNDSAAERLELRRDLGVALEEGQLFLVYQSRVHADTGERESAEALLRWRHPTRGLIPPDHFIALAEESGLITSIGMWVLREAMQQITLWRQLPQPPLHKLSVNLSPVQMAHKDFLQQVEALAQEFPQAQGAIEFEITEGALVRDIDATVRKLGRLRALGFEIALDDFGVGYSAMSYLGVLPFDTLKIDKSFVWAFGQQPSAYAIASAIVALARALNKRVVAEGVETQEQAAILRDLGVHELQGYLYSKPAPAEALTPAA